MAGDYSFGSQMGDDDNGPHADTLSSLLTYGADSDDETTGQPGGAPNVKSDASAPIAPAAHVQAVLGRAMSDGAPAAAGEGAGSSLAHPLVPLPVAPTPDLGARQKLTDQLATDQRPAVVPPKWWERLAGGAAAGLLAVGKVPGAVEAGQAVTNRGQIAEEQQRAGRVAADQTAIDAWNDGQKQQQQVFQDQHTAFEDRDRADSRAQLNSDRAAQESQRLQGIAPGTEAPDDPKNPLGTWHATSVDGKPIALQGPPDKWTKTPAGIAAQRAADVSAQRARGLKISPQDEKDYMLNGKVKDAPTTNIRVPSAETEALQDAKAAWQRENPGKKPTLADVAKIKAAASGKGDAGPKTGTPAQYAALDKDRDKRLGDIDATYNATVGPIPEKDDRTFLNRFTQDDPTPGYNRERQEAAQARDEAKRQVQDDYQKRLDDLGGPRQTPAANAAPAARAPQTPAPPKAGDVVRGYRFNGGDPSDKANWKKV